VCRFVRLLLDGCALCGSREHQNIYRSTERSASKKGTHSIWWTESCVVVIRIGSREAPQTEALDFCRKPLELEKLRQFVLFRPPIDDSKALLSYTEKCVPTDRDGARMCTTSQGGLFLATQKETLARNTAFMKSVREVIVYQYFEESVHEDSLACQFSNGQRPVLGAHRRSSCAQWH